MKPTGLSKDAGWIVGARRTFSISPGEAWRFIISEEGMRIWLGDLPDFKLVKGATFTLADGTRGLVTTFVAGSHFRKTRQPNDYPRSSILQVRIIPTNEKTTIAFHQEHLPNAGVRTERKEHFKQALEKILDLIENLTQYLFSGSAFLGVVVPKPPNCAINIPG